MNPILLGLSVIWKIAAAVVVIRIGAWFVTKAIRTFTDLK